MLRSYGTVILVWCVALLFSVIQHHTRKWLMPIAGRSDTGDAPAGWTQVAFLDLLFFVLLPGFVLVVFFPLLPFSGFRSGVALGLLAFLLGAGPAYIHQRVRKERSMAATMHDLFFHLCKMLACFGLLGAFYRP